MLTIRPIPRPSPAQQIEPIDPEVMKRVARWRAEHEAAAAKRAKQEEEAKKRGLTLSALRAERHQKWLLKNCRATIGEIITKAGK
jgi:hypothetical protein